VACAVHLMSLMLAKDDDDGFPAGCPFSLFRSPCLEKCMGKNAKILVILLFI